MNNNAKKELLEMSEEEIMILYATMFLKQNSYGALEFKNATEKHMKRTNYPLNKWRRELKLGNRPLTATLENWSLNENYLLQSYDVSLNCIVYYKGMKTERILGYDKSCNRVLTADGSIYELKWIVED